MCKQRTDGQAVFVHLGRVEQDFFFPGRTLHHVWLETSALGSIWTLFCTLKGFVAFDLESVVGSQIRKEAWAGRAVTTH